MNPLPFDYRLETARLTLRSPREEDMAFVFDASRNPGFNDGMLWDAPVSLEACRELYEDAVRCWESGECYVFTLVRRDSGEAVGRLGVRDGCSLSVGFWTHPTHQNNGYMTEALQAALRLAFETLEAPSVEACHADWNLASRRVLENCGFRFKRHVEQGFLKNGEWFAEDVLAISRQQWETARSRGL